MRYEGLRVYYVTRMRDAVVKHRRDQGMRGWGGEAVS